MLTTFAFLNYTKLIEINRVIFLLNSMGKWMIFLYIPFAISVGYIFYELLKKIDMAYFALVSVVAYSFLFFFSGCWNIFLMVLELQGV